MLIPASNMGEVGGIGGLFVADELVGEKKKSGKRPDRLSSNSLDPGAETSKCGICSTLVLNRGVLDCCTHWFCFACIDNWATVTNLCPLCKARFRFITCLPVGHRDHSSWEDHDHIGFGFAKRVDGSNDDDSSLPFSFPSYFIDEEAVVCLEGDACRVRAGVVSPDVEGALAADTSVACDLCDCWYHAGCVNFDPEQSSFYCPRCIASQENAENSLNPVNSGSWISPEARASSLVGSLPAEKELTYGGGTLLGSTSVAIAVAEEGESAVSLSMRRIPAQPSARPSSLSVLEDSGEMWSPIRETVNVSQTYGQIWSPIRETLNTSQNYELWSPTPGPISQDDNDTELLSPTPESERVSASSFKEQSIVAPMISGKSLDPMYSTQQNIDHEVLTSKARSDLRKMPTMTDDMELWSPTPESERASANSFEEQSIVAPVVSGKSLDPMYSMQQKIDHEVSTSTAYAVSAAGGDLSKRPTTTERLDIVGVETNSPAHVAPTAKPVRRPEDLHVGMMKDEEILIDSDRRQGAVEQLKKGKRKSLQEDERRIESKDLPEPPQKVARKSKKIDASKGVSLAVGKDSSNKILVQEKVSNKTDYSQNEGLRNAITSKERSKGISVDETETEMLNGLEHPAHISRPDKKKPPVVESNSHIDVMDIVSDPRSRLVKDKDESASMPKGVRTRIIMHRETDVKDKLGSSLVERIRQQMRDTTGYTGGEEVSKVEVSDDRFIAAFKAALTRSQEKSKETKPTASREGKSGWLAKVMNRNKGSRDSLTRKLYAGGTGRWDRDWDIAFWKERSAHLQRARKEAEDEIEDLGRAKKHVRGDGKQPNSEEDSIFSRLYVADTSLFPRNDDVQPLSVQAKNVAEGSSEACGQRALKGPQLSLDKGSLRPGFADYTGKSPIVRSLLDTRQTLEKFSGASDVLGNKGAATSRLADRSTGICAPSEDGSDHSKGLSTALTAKASVGSEGLEGSSPKLSNKSGLVQHPASTPSKIPVNELTVSKSDVKKDKRQWALEVLARKTGTSASESGSANTAGGSTNREGQFSLLLQLPIELRPLLPHNRRSKVPTAVRQVQLNRIVEQELRRANLPVIQNGPECEEVVNRAKSREEELYRKSNSKGVYVNLCVRSLAQTDTAVTLKQETQLDLSDIVQKALEATGLVDSPPASPSHLQDVHSPVSTSNSTQLSSKDSGVRSKQSCEHKWVENVLEMNNLDIYGDFEFSLDNDEDPVVLENPHSSKLEPATAIQDADNRIKRLTVVLTTSSNAAPEPAKVLPETLLETQMLYERTQDAGATVDHPPVSEASLSQVGSHTKDDDDLYSGLEARVTSNPHNADAVGSLQKSSAHSEPSSMLPPKESGDRKSVGSTVDGLENNVQSFTNGDGSQSPIQAGNPTMDDWMNSGKFADLDRRIEKIRQSTSPNGQIDVPWNSNRSSVELRVQSDLQSSGHSVQKQVEIYVNQHLKPLYRSGVINADQFRYAVSKTATKVMEHHQNASSADFLITEGSKVKKLADQYLQAFSKRKLK